MSVFQNELVLSLVQPYLTTAVDHVNSQLVSKYLFKTGSENPTRPVPPFGHLIKQSREKKDSVRLAKHCSKLGVKEVYLESELPKIHEELMKLSSCDILDVNSSIEKLKEDSFNCEVECGVYIPVIYPRQNKPIWSMIYAGKNHSLKDAKVFVKSLEKMKLYGAFHGGLQDIIVESAKSLIQKPDIEYHPQYQQFLSDARSPRPFVWQHTTLTYRWEDLHSNKKPRVTYG